jgi:hypothetical protein
MSEQDTTEQLYAMRAQLQRMEQERLAREKDAAESERIPPVTESAPESEALPPELASWLGEDTDIDAEAVVANLKAGIGRWLDGFDEDLKNTRPSTLLLVFGLGVMVGKMTA